MADISDSDTGSSVESEAINVIGSDTATGVDSSGSVDNLQVWLTLRSPLNDFTAPSITPSFSFTAARMAAGINSVTVQLQVSPTPNFSTGNLVLELDVTNLDGRTLNTIGVSSGLADGTDYYWRLRQVQPFGVFGAWTESWHFSTDAASSGNSFPVSMTVTSATPTPYLWFTQVTRARVDGEFTLYGQGFGNTGANNPDVTLVNSTCVVTGYSLVAAGVNAYTADRVIDGDTGEISVEHGETVAVVPDAVVAPGGPVSLSSAGSIPDPPTPALWYMASDIDLGDTTEWPAHASAGPTLTGGVADIVTSSLNGQPGVDFSDVFTSNEYYADGFVGIDPSVLRVFYAIKRLSAATDQSGSVFAGTETAVGGVDYFQFGPFNTETEAYIADSGGSNYLDEIYTDAADTALVAEWQYSPLVYKENRIVQTPIFTDEPFSPPTLSNPIDAIWIGAIPGLIYEVIVYDRSLTTNEEDQIYTYFDTKYAGSTPTAATSNSVFFEVLPQPLEEIGWEVKVLSHTDFTTELATIPRFSDLTVGVELSGPGGGSITLDLDDIVFTNTLSSGDPSSYLLDYENLWNAYYNGVLRGQWFGTSVEEIVASDGEVRGVTVSGPGPADVLKRAVVLPAGFPQSQVSSDPLAPVGLPASFAPEPIFEIYLAYLAEAQARGTIPFVNPMFTDTGDSGGVEWADTNATGWSPLFEIGVFDPSAVLGKNLYELLVTLSGKDVTKPSTVIVDWLMRPGFRLDVRKFFGSHLEDRVIFSIGGAIKTVQRTRVREKINNIAVVRDELGQYSIAMDDTSITNFGRREVLVQKSGPQAVDPALRPQIAAVILEQNKDEKSSWVVKVAPDNEGRVVFEDYNVGDWVGAEDIIGVVSPYRVLVITVNVDIDGQMTVELILQSLLELREEELARQLTLIDNIISNLPYPDVTFPDTFNPDEFGLPVYDPLTGGLEMTNLDGLGGGGLGDGIGGGIGGGGFGGGIKMFIQPDDPGDAASEGDMWYRLPNS